MKIAVGVALGAAVALVGPAAADTAEKRIALSNNYAGNSWRQAMLKSWDKVTRPAVADGVVAAADAFTTAENQATEQAAQIQNLILQGYDAIVLNAASPDGAQRRGQGGLRRRDHRGLASTASSPSPAPGGSPSTSSRWARTRSHYLAEKLPDGGKLLEIRGLAGVFVDDEIRAGIHEGVAENPQFKIVGSVHGDWAQDVAQKAVAGILPSLPEDIVGGGDPGRRRLRRGAGLQGRRPRRRRSSSWATARTSCSWWKEQKDASGYETMSVSIAPGVSTLAFWVAQQILDGKEVPKDLVVPFLRIDQDNLEDNLATTEQGGVANVEYSLEDAKKVIAGK